MLREKVLVEPLKADTTLASLHTGMKTEGWQGADIAPPFMEDLRLEPWSPQLQDRWSFQSW